MFRKKSVKLEWFQDSHIQKDIEEIVKTLELSHINPKRIFCYRTDGSTSRSYARIWSFPKIFQEALDIPPAYVIEVLSKHYDKLGHDDRKKVLIHELLHIPKNFSGALLPHRSRGRHLGSLVNTLFKKYKSQNIV
jgi:predicted metallopeptidase